MKLSDPRYPGAMGFPQFGQFVIVGRSPAPRE
jgi:hypothetical protein